MEKKNRINCLVEECAYHNENFECTANSIEVGNCKPTTTRCEDTLCGTFKIKKDPHN